MSTRAGQNLPSLLFRLVFFYFLFAALSGGVAVQAQDNTPKRGFQPANSFALSDVETINTTNGNLILNLPIGSLPSGRGGMSATMRLLYNSKIYDSEPEWVVWTGGNPNPQVVQQNHLGGSAEGGWRYGTGYQLLTFNKLDQYAGLPGDLPPGTNPTPQCFPVNNPAATHIWKLKIAFPDGSAHEMIPLGYTNYQGEGYFEIRPDGFLETCAGGQWTSNDLTYYSVDGTFLKLVIKHNSAHNGLWNNEWTLYFPDGGRVTFNEPGAGGQRIYDRNNNYIELQNTTHNGHPATKMVDQLGRWVILEYGSGSQQDSIHEQGVGGTTVTWTIKWKNLLVQNKKYVCADGVSGGGWPHEEYLNVWHYVVDQITLPQTGTGLNYTFDYNPGTGSTSYGWGELSLITLPTGVVNPRAKVEYDYSLDGQDSVSYGTTWKDVLKASSPTRKDLTYLREYDGSANSTTETWLYNIQPVLGSSYVTEPDGGSVTETYGGDTGSVYWSQGLVTKLEKSDGTVVERIWAENKPNGLPVMYSGVNPYIKTEFTSTKDAGGTLVKTAIKDYTYDKNGNVLQVAEYDWVAYSSVPRTGGAPTGIPGGATIQRVTVNTWYNPTPDASVTSTASYTYNQTTSPQFKQAIESSEVRSDFSASNALSRTENFYDNSATTGNLTSQLSWDSTKSAISRPLTGGNSITVSHTYDGYGNRTLTTDAKGYQAKFTYGTVGGFTGLYVTQTETAYGTAIERTTNNTYDFHTGLVLTTTDADNSVTNKTTYDVFGRPTLVEEADGVSGVERQTATQYDDDERYVIVRADLNTTGDQKLVSIQHYDQLGRVRLSRSLEDAATQSATNEQHGIKVQTRYAYSGSNSYEVVSAAYRAATSSGASGEAEMAWRLTKFDNGGKVLEMGTFAGATLPAPWGGNTTSTGKVTTAYDAEFTTVTDQMNRSRRSMVDGLGRLVRMDEPDAATGSLGTTASPVQPTNYTYNALDKLTQSVQGSQTRTFNYSSLSRLTSATNPENGTVSYTYDNNGNLATKTDARSIVSTYTYDQLNRNTGISYSGGASPAIQRYYDGATKGKGKLWYSLSYNVHPTSGQLAYSYTIVDSYDEMGRAKTGSQNFLTNNGSTWMSYPISRTFDVAGNVKTQSYPSTRGTSYNYDNAGRISSFSGTIGDGLSRTYADSFLFNAKGQIKHERFGTGTALYHNIHYNSRGQAVDIRLGTNSADEWTWNRGALITYFSNQARSAGNAFLNANDNNGNVTMQEHYVPTDDAISSYAIPLRDTYEYDALNRVTQANGVQRTTGGSWPSVYAQHYSYDRWGNRWINSATTWGTNIFNTVITPDSANNRLTGMTYDSAGNTTNDTITGGGARTYDADNRMTSAQSGATWNYYVYDADGKRVRRIVTGTETWHVYGFSGELLAEYPVNGATNAPSKEYANGGQTMIVGDATNVRWTVADSLGTPRIVVGKSGALADVTRHDYLPFGEELFVGMGTGSVRTTGMGYANSGTNDGIRKKFTGYERDDETGLDYAQARYYSSKQGRFTSPDEFTGGPDELYDFADVASENPMIYAELDEPQSLNKYQYCFNNPLSLVDPDGHKSWKDWARTVVEVATYVPGPIGTVASVVQAVDKLAQGDYAGAASSALGAVPGAKLVRAGAKALDKIADTARIVDKVNDTRRQAGAVNKAGAACGLCFTAGTKVSTPDGLVNIEDIRVGDRVTTTGINKDRPDGWTAVDPKQWRVIKLLMPDPKGSEDVYEIELLRSLEWIRKVGAAPRRFIEIEMAEMGLNGLAKVMSITPSPKIKPGAGRMVLMTVTHMDQGVMEIEFAGLKRALEPTVSHPLFSADRNNWVAAGELRIGERIKTKTGTSEIKEIRWKTGEHRVYNFEVEADHAYFVTEIELLSHNANGCSKTYQTYTKTKTATGEVYSGRTSGTGTPLENIARRDKSHQRNADGFGPAVLDKSSKKKAAIRGREQQLIDHHRANGTAADQINGISPKNPNGTKYLKAAEKEFGEIE